MIRKLIYLLMLFISSAAYGQAIDGTSGIGGIKVSAVPAAPYVGPGDVVSTSVWGYWGLRGWTAAYAAPGTNPAIDVCDAATGATCTTGIVILSNGKLDVATAAAAPACAVQCSISKRYDQSGNGRDMTDATVANRYTLVFNCIGSLPCMSGSVSANTSTVATVAAASPLSFVSTVERTGGFTSIQGILSTNGAQVGSFFTGSANTVETACGGSPLTATGVADNAWHAIGSLCIGTASDIIAVDGVSMTGAAGTNEGNSTAVISGFASPFGLQGNLIEDILYAGTALTPSNFSNLKPIQCNYFGNSIC